MSIRKIATAMAVSWLAVACASAQSANESNTNLEILQTYAADYALDVTFKEDITLGVKVGEEFYAVEGVAAKEGAPARVSVSRGEPATPSIIYSFESETELRQLYSGELNIFTLMARAFEHEVTPVRIQAMDGYTPPEDVNPADVILPLTFHFWTKGQPELIPFGPDLTRFTHGTNAGIFYYQPGFRSIWFDIRPGHHVNENEESRSNPFPSMLILVEGSVTAIVNDKTSSFTAGTTMFIPANVNHHFINNGEQSARGFLLMFGDGA
ncbi:MAG: hypothetical protein DHS20C05_13860 [Hyphococcus sp.]|nr:MAG: hypothetical protein DHS20C05_13860 [Marinicaulis sp.]